MWMAEYPELLTHKIGGGLFLVKRILGFGSFFSPDSPEEINEAVTFRDRVLAARHMINWMIKKKYSGTLEQMQEYHDERNRFLPPCQDLFLRHLIHLERFSDFSRTV